jgi:hypothetical protein
VRNTIIDITDKHGNPVAFCTYCGYEFTMATHCTRCGQFKGGVHQETRDNFHREKRGAW